MATATRQRVWIEFIGTCLGAIVVAILFPGSDGILLALITIFVAFYRLMTVGVTLWNVVGR